MVVFDRKILAKVDGSRFNGWFVRVRNVVAAGVVPIYTLLAPVR